MGQLNITQIQLGQHATAANNFVISVPSTPDGTLTIARGVVGATTQDVLTVDASGVISFPADFSFAPHFTSTDQTITSAGLLTLAHGLGAIPSLVAPELVCQTADAGWSAGDVIPISFFGSASGGSGLAAYSDATNVNIRYSSTVSAVQYPHKTTGVATNLTNASWKLRIKAWR